MARVAAPVGRVLEPAELQAELVRLEVVAGVAGVVGGRGVEEQRRAGLRDVVRAVARPALGGRGLELRVATLLVEVLGRGVALAADLDHGGRRRRLGVVRAVAGGAARGTDVLVLEEGDAVDAPGVDLVLVGGDAVWLHTLGIRVAPGAQLGDVEREDLAGRVRHLLDVVDAVAVGADRDPRVPRGHEALAVHARPVLRVLVRRAARRRASSRRRHGSSRTCPRIPRARAPRRSRWRGPWPW